MSSGKLLSGIVIGAVIGLLIAPDKGSETRKKISKAGAGLKDNIMNKLNELGEAISDKYSEVHDEAKGQLQSGVDKAKNINNEVRESFS